MADFIIESEEVSAEDAEALGLTADGGAAEEFIIESEEVSADNAAEEGLLAEELTAERTVKDVLRDMELYRDDPSFYLSNEDLRMLFEDGPSEASDFLKGVWEGMAALADVETYKSIGIFFAEEVKKDLEAKTAGESADRTLHILGEMWEGIMGAVPPAMVDVQNALSGIHSLFSGDEVGDFDRFKDRYFLRRVAHLQQKEVASPHALALSEWVRPFDEETADELEKQAKTWTGKENAGWRMAGAVINPADPTMIATLGAGKAMSALRAARAGQAVRKGAGAALGAAAKTKAARAVHKGSKAVGELSTLPTGLIDKLGGAMGLSPKAQGLAKAASLMSWGATVDPASGALFAGTAMAKRMGAFRGVPAARAVGQTLARGARTPKGERLLAKGAALTDAGAGVAVGTTLDVFAEDDLREAGKRLAKRAITGALGGRSGRGRGTSVPGGVTLTAGGLGVVGAAGAAEALQQPEEERGEDGAEVAREDVSPREGVSSLEEGGDAPTGDASGVEVDTGADVALMEDVGVVLEEEEEVAPPKALPVEQEGLREDVRADFGKKLRALPQGERVALGEIATRTGLTSEELVQRSPALREAFQDMPLERGEALRTLEREMFTPEELLSAL